MVLDYDRFFKEPFIKFLLIFYHLLNIQNNIGKQSVVNIQINLLQPLAFKPLIKHWRTVRQVENSKLQPKRGTVKIEIEKKELTFYFWSNSSPKMSLFSGECNWASCFCATVLERLLSAVEYERLSRREHGSLPRLPHLEARHPAV